jgi:hypothetical protein
VLSGVQLAEADLENIPVSVRHSAEEILAHPRFAFARAAFVKTILAGYEHNPFLSRLLLESGRTVVFIMIMCLNARHDRSDRATWPTMRLVTEQTVAHGVASPRRVYDLVRRLIVTGYLDPCAAPQDRRTRILTPTRMMIAQDEAFLVSHYLPLQILFPEPGYRRIMRRDPAFQRTQRLVSADLFARGARIMTGDPVMTSFLGRDAGGMILLKLMDWVGPSGEMAPLAFSFSEIGARIGVSRTHVRNLLEEAEQQGLVRLRRGSSQLVEATPALVLAFDRFIAESMASHDLIYNLALARSVDLTRPERIGGASHACPTQAHRAEDHRESQSDCPRVVRV